MNSFILIHIIVISFIENYDYFVKELETDDYFYGLEDSKDE